MKNKRKISERPDEEDLYWEDLEMQETDPSHITMDEIAAIEEIIDASSHDYFGKTSEKYDDDDFDDALNSYLLAELKDYWKQLIRSRWKSAKIKEEPDSDDKIQSYSDLAILDHYRESLLALERVPDDKIRIVFWQKQFEKFNKYCFDHDLINMIQLFHKDLSSLRIYGFNFTRIVQISAVMTAWAENILNPEKEVAPSEKENYEKILSFFFDDNDDQAQDTADESNIEETDTEDDYY